MTSLGGRSRDVPWLLCLALLLSAGCTSGALALQVAACPSGVDASLAWTGNPQNLTDGSDLLVLGRDGVVRQLTRDGTSSDPSFSPDGRRLVFVSNGPGGGFAAGVPDALQLFVMASDGSGRRALTSPETEDVEPAWSPDGSTIVFRRAGTGLMTVSASGGEPELLLARVPSPAGPIEPRLPEWSPDGTRLAFAASAGMAPGEDRVFVARADGTHVEVLADGFEYVQSLSWEPDGSSLAVAQGSPAEPSLFLVPLGGGDDARVRLEPELLLDHHRLASWSPSGDRLYTLSISRRRGFFDSTLQSVDPSGQDAEDIATVTGEPPAVPDWGLDAPACDAR